MKNLFRTATLAACALALAACDASQQQATESGKLRARIASDTVANPDFASVRIDIVRGQEAVATQTLSASGGTPTGDAYFVLRPGAYVATATPLDEKGNPSQTCSAASAAANVFPKVTNEISLAIFCKDQGSGGLDVVITTEHGVIITDLKFQPSKFVQVCSPLSITVGATDVEKLPMTYRWFVEASPVGSDYVLSPSGNTTQFMTDTVGDYTLGVQITDAHGHDASLTFPVHETDGATCKGGKPLEFQVDTSLKPGDALPGIKDPQKLRPLSALTDKNGLRADFVQDELLVQAPDQAALDAFLSRWGGYGIISPDFAAAGLDLGPIALVHVDPSAADETLLADDLIAIAGPMFGQGRFSSLAAYKLMALAAHEKRVNGLSVNLNFVARSAGLSDRTLAEAPTGNAGYTPNPFAWPYMRAGGVQDIGVTEAWRDLALTGILNDQGVISSSRRVNLMIMDAGFVVNADFPASAQMFPSDALGRPNAWGCSTGPGCMWHGTEVVQAAMGQVNNGFGTAGPGGPVANALMVQSPSLDLGQILNYVTSALPSALASRPRIINMSFELDLPAWTGPAVDLFGVFTNAVRRSGVLIFAAAGNKNIDVDRLETTCFGICVTYRPTLVVPCINQGVTCVGGLEVDSTTKADDGSTGSNFGESRDPHSGTVALFAPYRVWMGVDPDHGANDAHLESGTSFSSPFVAGIASLVMAADPTLSADQVEQILLDTAHTGSPDGRVPRWVNAHAAVRAALGSTRVCEPPTVTISSPANGFTVSPGATVSYSGYAMDLGTGMLPATALSWVDNGVTIGGGGSINATYSSAGTHDVSLVAHGCSAISAQRTIRVNVVSPSPVPNSAQILSPSNGAGFVVDGGDPSGFYKDVALSGSATNADGSPVPGARLRWSYSIGGVRTEIGAGNNPVVRLYNNTCVTKTYTVTLEVLDAAGAVIPSLTRSIQVQIFNAPC